MPARNTLNNKLAATTLVVVIATAMLWGCASTIPFSDQSQSHVRLTRFQWFRMGSVLLCDWKISAKVRKQMHGT